jgi:AraC-like DNA-binding protein
MMECRTAIFDDPDVYRTSIPGVSLNLVLTARGDFKAHLTWINLRRLRLVRCEESVPCIAFMMLAPGRVVLSFPTHHDPPPIWQGVRMQPSEIVLHSLGEHFHQRTSGSSSWGLISLAPNDFADYGKALAHVRLTPPPGSKFQRPPPKAVTDLLRLHANACRLAKSKADRIAQREIARALEQDLLHALFNCLTAEEAHRYAAARQRHAEIMARFEEVLAEHEMARIPTPELAAVVGVAERSLRTCCAKFLGMSPSQYMRLRRLNLVREALRRADPATASVGAIARQYGFSELGRFAGAYRTAFGEVPSTTLHCLD